MTLREAATMALKALEEFEPVQYLDDVVAPALRAALAEPVQPVAWIWKDGTVTVDPDRADGTWTPLYTAPPQRKPLTDEEIGRICAPLGFAQLNPVEVARAIEAAHGIIGGEE